MLRNNGARLKNTNQQQKEKAYLNQNEEGLVLKVLVVLKQAFHQTTLLHCMGCLLQTIYR